MSGVWLVSYVVLWVLTALLVLFALVAARQFGLVHSELASIGSSSAMRADVGSTFPTMQGRDLEGHRVLLRGIGAERTLIIVVSPECASCDAASTLVRDVHRKWTDLDVIVVAATDDLDAARDFLRRNNLADVTFVLAASVLTRLMISETPCGIFVDRDGTIVGRAALRNVADLTNLENVFGRGGAHGNAVAIGKHAADTRAEC